MKEEETKQEASQDAAVYLSLVRDLGQNPLNRQPIQLMLKSQALRQEINVDKM